MEEHGIFEAVGRIQAAGALPVLLVRHARTADNAARILVGRRDVPLDAEGERQAEAVCARLAPLGFAARYSSPLARARHTIRALGPATVLEALVEVDHGALEGLREAALAAAHADLLDRWRRDPATTRLPGGESLGEAVARAHTAILAACGQHGPPAPVLFCGHQLVLAGFCCAVLGAPLACWPKYACANTGITLLARGWRDWTVHLKNDLAHLEADSGR
jgi:broad specificity phosphatase PhoE